jgi:hypothetical protein
MLQVGIKEPILYAKYNDKQVRITMASRLGDVGVTEDLTRERGYDKRVCVDDLSDFTDVLT